jgi:hypothetical protein
MRIYATVYMAGMLLLLLGERLLSDAGSLHYAASGTGLLAALASIALCHAESSKAGPEQATAYRLSKSLLGVGLLSFLPYFMSTDAGLSALSLGEEAEHRAEVVLRALAGIIWISSALPMLAIANRLSAGPRHLNAKRSKELFLQWIGLAWILAALFPVNYVAQDMNHRWDLGYFKTAQPGSSTLAIVDNLSEPVTAYLFFPGNSEVTQEIRTYFDLLESPKLTKSYLDHALEPELSKELKVRDNGYIVIAKGEGDEQQLERVKIGKNFDSARRKLKKLDSEVREALLKIARGPSVAYFTTGHGELHWKTSEDKDKDSQITDMKKVLRSFNYTVKELGSVNGLSNEVPEDAQIVFAVGPTEDFLPEELDTLKRYREAGGSLFLALEPGGAGMEPLLSGMGIRFDGSAYLASERYFIPRTNKPVDRRNLVTNKFSTHPSVTTLSVNNKVLAVIFPEAGVLEKTEDSKATATIRSLEKTWKDSNGNLSLDEGEESRVWEMALAVSEEVDGVESKSLVVADATWLSDLLLVQNKGNAQALLDAVSWLSDEPSTTGTVNDENDVKVQHTKEGQGWIFYATTLLLPLGLFLLGAVRIHLRRRKE